MAFRNKTTSPEQHSEPPSRAKGPKGRTPWPPSLRNAQASGCMPISYTSRQALDGEFLLHTTTRGVPHTGDCAMYRHVVACVSAFRDRTHNPMSTPSWRNPLNLHSLNPPFL